MSREQSMVKLPYVEGISAEVMLGTLPTIDELLELGGMMPLIIASEMPDPIVATKIMVGARPFDGYGEVPLVGVRFLGNIDLADTQEVEDSMDALLRPYPNDGPPVERDSCKAIRLQVNKSDTSIILSSGSVISSDDDKIPKRDLCALTSQVSATAMTVARNYNDRDTSGVEPPIDMGRFVLSQM